MYDITLHHLKVFCLVVDSGGVSAAAKALNMSQPSVSAQIRRLEAMVGQPLLERRPGRSAELTDAGRVVYASAREISVATENMADLIRELASGGRGHVELAASRSVVPWLVRDALVDHYRRWPNVNVVVHGGTLPEVERLVGEGHAAFGLVTTGEPQGSLSARRIGSVPLLVVAGTGHPLASKQAVSPEDLARYPSVTALRSSRHFKMVQALLAGAGIALGRVAMEFDDSVAIKEAVIGGVGVAALLATSVADAISAGLLVVLPVSPGPPPMELRLTYLAQHHFTPSEQRLIGLVRANLAARWGRAAGDP